MRNRLLLLLLAAALAGCTPASAAPGPRELVPGVDVCAQCHMGVDDPGLAAQWVEADGGRSFDEPGCLVAWLGAHPGAAGAPFVRDHGGSGWVEAPAAWYVRSPGRTGMGYGVVAFRDRAAAAARARETGGRVSDWETLRREGVRDAHAH